ncbi:hypothetical protein CHS0354_042001 [Potamilus streckersoni]|uniref:STAS domain-containing protein n=1 Tax=Potamilus streckersoni TaxID=2493646 RepID=A0AAE0T9Q2_9BIVA|nr:hypothetical protein CHS0354_042001 [Potamilus streckersoni]
MIVTSETVVKVSDVDEEAGVDNPVFSPSMNMTEIPPSLYITDIKVKKTDSSALVQNGKLLSSNQDPPTTEEKFRNDFLLPEENTSLREVFCDQFKKCCLCSKERCNRIIDKILPCYKVLRKYKVKEDLPNDIICGLTVGIMQLPQGMAYAMLAELPPVVGLYVSFFPVLIYFLLGTSRHVSAGTVAVISLLTGSVIAKITDVYKSNTGVDILLNNSINANDTGDSAVNTPNVFVLPDDVKIGIAMSLAILVGFTQIALGLLRLGFVTTYISDALVGGFTTGTAVHVGTSQVKNILGIKIPRTDGLFQIINTYKYIFLKIVQTNIPTLVISIICMALLYIVKEQVNQRFKKKLKVPIPIELCVVVLGTVTSHFWNFNKRFHVQIVGDIPTGMPTPSYPSFQHVDVYITEIFIIAIISFAQSVSLAALMAKRHNYSLDSNQELLAYGAGNVFGSFFSCYPYAASVSRSSVQESAGGKTQLASLFSCSMVLIVILWIGYLFESLPNCVLSAIIVVALKSLILQFMELPQIWRTSKYDFFIWVVTCGCTVILHVDYGLIIGLGFSFLTVVIRTQRAVVSPMSKISDTEVYRNPNKYILAKEKPGIKIVGFNSPLYFANGEMFVTKLHKITGVKPEKIKKQLRRMAMKDVLTTKDNFPAEEDTEGSTTEPATGAPINTVMNGHVTKHMSTRADICVVHHIIIDFSAVPFIDSVGAKILKQVFDDYATIDIKVFLACIADDVWSVLETTRFVEKYSDNIFTTLDSAVIMALLDENKDFLNAVTYV